MVFYTEQLYEKYKDYVDKKGKIAREVKSGKLFPVVRGIYENNPKIEGYKLAQFIYSPSYLSFDFALYYYDLIPERVFNYYTSATLNKRKKKVYKNYFGEYSYRDVPKSVFHIGVKFIKEDGHSYQIATKEKAICDKLYSLYIIKNIKELEYVLFEDLRIDEEDFDSLDQNLLLKLAPLYKSKNLYLLEKLIKRRNKHK